MNLKVDYSSSEFRDKTYTCSFCTESITNPLCPFCLAEEIQAWLTLYPHLKEDILSSLNDYLKKINNSLTSYGVVCIKCGEDRASVCPYCFTEFVFKKLIEIKANRLVLKEFFDFFDFDLEHKGYIEFVEELK
jgi:hypothetical protein